MFFMSNIDARVQGYWLMLIKDRENGRREMCSKVKKMREKGSVDKCSVYKSFKHLIKKSMIQFNPK